MWKAIEVWKIYARLLDAALAPRVNPPPEDGQKPEAFDRVPGRSEGFRPEPEQPKTRDYLFAVRRRQIPAFRRRAFTFALRTTHWGFMVQAFENLVLTRSSRRPLERTLLANGIMLAGLESRRRGGTWIDTPELGLSY